MFGDTSTRTRPARFDMTTKNTMDDRIAACFIELVKASPNHGKRISVTALTSSLNIDRKTFYNHFSDTTELVIWIYRDAVRTMLAGSAFSGSEKIYPRPDSNDPFPDMPFYVRIKGEGTSLNQRLFYRGIGEILQANREFYERIFSDSCYLNFFNYIVELYLPALRDDIIYILGNDREMPDVAINFLAEYHVMSIFGRLKWHYAETKRFMMQEELEPFWNYAHETVSRTVDSMFDEPPSPTLLRHIMRRNKQVYTGLYS